MGKPVQKRQCARMIPIRDENGKVVRDAHGKALLRQCRGWAMHGVDQCPTHAGHKTRKQSMTHRQARGVRKLLAECDLPDQHPVDGLLEVVRHAGGMFRLLSEMVGDLDAHPGGETLLADEDGNVVKAGALYGLDHNKDGAPHILVELYGVWSDRYARACKLALDADIDERLVRNAEATSELLFGAIGRALSAADLSPVQAGRVRAALAAELRTFTGPGALEVKA